jgi:hypothetical protein
MKTYHVLLSFGEYEDYNEVFIRGYRCGDDANDLKEKIEQYLEKTELDVYAGIVSKVSKSIKKRTKALHDLEDLYGVFLGSALNAYSVIVKEFDIVD